MDAHLIAEICAQVYRRFPEVEGSQPRQQSFPGENLLFIFHGSAQTSDGKKMDRTVRVVVSPFGKIIKMTTSR